MSKKLLFMKIILFAISLSSTTQLMSTTSAEDSETSAFSQSANNIICGPRCVQSVLNYYGNNDDDLLDLVREIQWPDLEKGASLRSLEIALQKRDIYTSALCIPKTSDIYWEYPCIVWLKTEEALGHYAIWLPDNTIWSWGDASNWTKRDWNTEKGNFTGVILLTSTNPIIDSKNAIIGISDRSLWIGIGMYYLCIMAWVFSLKKKDTI